MKSISLVLFLLFLTYTVNAQLYFPPNNSNIWDTLSPSHLGWCQPKIDSFYNFLDSNNTKAFILLKDGKIVLEKYFDGHSQSSNWYWASAGKSLTSFLTGIAQQENYLDINDTSSSYLGQGWTDCSAQQEANIKIINQLSMTTGLDDAISNPDCTFDTCLQYLTDPGTRWAYHNAPYTLIDQVIENAVGQSLNLYNNLKVKSITGMDGLYLQTGFNNVFFSTARSMARFGLLVLNKGVWNGNPVLNDTSYYNAMINSSQNLNPSYGYLWWLNGKSSFMIPQSQFVFNGSLSPNAPGDMFAALGKNGQFINIVPSQNLVWIRMGDSPDNTLVPFTFSDDIWTYLNDLTCPIQSFNQDYSSGKYNAYPNPVENILHIDDLSKKWGITSYELFDFYGNKLEIEVSGQELNFEKLKSGVYFLKIWDNKTSHTLKVIKK